MPARCERRVEAGPRPAWVRGLRCHLDMSQREFADHLGVGRSTIEFWESGRYWPQGLTYKAILGAAQAAGYPPPPAPWEQDDYERQHHAA